MKQADISAPECSCPPPTFRRSAGSAVARRSARSRVCRVHARSIRARSRGGGAAARVLVARTRDARLSGRVPVLRAAVRMGEDIRDGHGGERGRTRCTAATAWSSAACSTLHRGCPLLPAGSTTCWSTMCVEPSRWSQRAGGQVLNGPMEVPGGDWIAPCMDPQGAIVLYDMNADKVEAEVLDLRHGLQFVPARRRRRLRRRRRVRGRRRHRDHRRRQAEAGPDPAGTGRHQRARSAGR